jgi:trigger factor
MPTTVTETGPFERLVTFQLTEDQITAGKAETARKLSRDLKLKGFRPGKAPLPVVEAAVGPDRLRSEVIDDLVSPALSEILTEEELRPAVTPSLEALNDVDGGVEVEVKVTLWPSIELPDYKDREVEVDSPAVTPEELESQLRRMLEQFATVEEVERAAATGDFVSIDVKATKDGEPIEGATAADVLYEIGSEMLIEGIDERLEGVESGAVLEFEAPLPAGFGDRAGEQVVFEIVVHEIKERILPDLDDSWVDENTEFETVDEMRTQLEEQLGQMKLQAVARQFAERALSTLVDHVEVELPEGLIRSEMDDQLHTFVHRLEDSDLTLDDYFAATGLTQDQFLDDLRQQADRALRNQLVLEAVAQDADIEITPEEVSSVIQGLAARSDDPVAYLQAFRQSGRELAVAGDILRNRALDAILSAANPVDEEGNPVDLRLNVTEVEAEVVEAEPIGDSVGAIVEGEVVGTAAEEEE